MCVRQEKVCGGPVEEETAFLPIIILDPSGVVKPVLPSHKKKICSSAVLL